ncbi:CIS tube protein [Sorangium sp. So ce117]|uniref:CIS tube protein n=1 Tax=Sorangium sp. So ce117 TaxID=3133277 RepID=UPI003F5EF9F7
MAQKPQKLRITPSAGAAVEVLFNPTEYTISQSNLYADVRPEGTEQPILQFVGGDADELSLDLLIDTTDPSRGVRDANKLAKPILDLARIHKDLHAPPVCTFAWGGEIMKGVVTSLRRQFLLFDPASGVPMRILISLSVKRYRTLSEQITGMNRQSPDRTKSVVVRQGDTLPSIAEGAYGDAAMWRPIAEHNKLADPARLAPGLVLEVPAIVPALRRGA